MSMGELFEIESLRSTSRSLLESQLMEISSVTFGIELWRMVDFLKRVEFITWSDRMR